MARADLHQFDMFAVLEPQPAVEPMFPTEWEFVPVAATGDTTEANVDASYSGDTLTSGKVRNPFRFRGGEWVCTGASFCRGYADHDCYRIVPIEEFTGPGEALPYGNHDFFGAHRAELGGYHGMAAKHRGSQVVLVGPPVLFVHRGDAK